MIIDWEMVWVVMLLVGIFVYALFFEQIIAAFDSLADFVEDELQRISQATLTTIHACWFRIIQVLIFTALLTALSSEVFANQKAPPSGAFYLRNHY